MKKIKTIKNNIKVEINMAMGGLQTACALVLRSEKFRRERKPLRAAGLALSSPLHSFFSFLFDWGGFEEVKVEKRWKAGDEKNCVPCSGRQEQQAQGRMLEGSSSVPPAVMVTC